MFQSEPVGAIARWPAPTRFFPKRPLVIVRFTGPPTLLRLLRNAIARLYRSFWRRQGFLRPVSNNLRAELDTFNADENAFMVRARRSRTSPFKDARRRPAAKGTRYLFMIRVGYLTCPTEWDRV
jgi:hypothetical protein